MEPVSSTAPADHARAIVNAPLFTALLRPHRSLSARRLSSIIGLVALCGFLAALPFVVIGYWPIAGFYGLDVALLYWAFRQNMREARAFEEINLTALELSVRKVDATGREARWVFAPLWTRLEQDRGADAEIRHLQLISRGVHLTIADCLSPADREDFSHCLATALREARKGPVFQNSF
jgi:uncharacterized membrane protein